MCFWFLSENGKDRRCVYSDGDVEDVSLGDLIALHNQQMQVGQSQNAAKSKMKTTKASNPKSKQSKKKDPEPISKGLKRPIASTETSNGDSPGNGFSPMKWEVPIDEAAESTILRPDDAALADRASAKGDDDDEDEHMTDMWLEQVASRFLKAKGKGAISNAKRRKSMSSATSSVATDRMCPAPPADSPAVVDSSEESVQSDFLSLPESTTPAPSKVEGPNEQAEHKLISLLDLKSGSRFGVKVFLVEDKKRLVGEVCLELLVDALL